MKTLPELKKFLAEPRSLEDVAAFLPAEWRTAYRRLRKLHDSEPLGSVFFGGRACFVLLSAAQLFDKKSNVRHKGKRGPNDLR